MRKVFIANAVAGVFGAMTAAATTTWILRTPPLQAEPRSTAERGTSGRTLAILDDVGQVFEQVARAVSPSVVSIESRHYDHDGKGRSDDFGSGVVIRPKRDGTPVVLTNLHVLGSETGGSIDVFLADGRVVQPTRIWRDPDTDLALLSLPISDLPVAKLADSDEARVGQWVLVVGSPFGLTQTVTHGIISARKRRQVGMPGNIRIKEFLQTDAPINPGNSGGPLVNLKGEVLGINTAIASYTGKNSGVGFSIPSNLVRWVAEELVTHGKVRRAYLGVNFPENYDANKAVELGLLAPRGALVASIAPNSPASAAGLQSNDVILEFDGNPIDDENHLINTVALTPIGKSVEIVVWRERTRTRLATYLSEWEKPVKPKSVEQLEGAVQR